MRVFHMEGKKNTLVWNIFVVKDEVHTESGILGGALKRTYDVPGAMGKKGTKSYVTPEAQALLVAERKIRKKMEEGYVEVDPATGKKIGSSIGELTFDKLPKNISFFKPRHPPKNKREQQEFDRLIDHGNPIITLKRDGMMHPILITNTGSVRIYSRRMDDCTEWYPSIVNAINALRIPPRTILMTELIVVNNGIDDRLKMQAISRSLVDRAVQLQQLPDHHVQAIVLAAPVVNGTPIMLDRPIEECLSITYNLIKPKRSYPIKPIEICNAYNATKSKDHRRMLEEIQNDIPGWGYEGLVIYDGNAVFGEDTYNFRGKPERPACWKWKPILEDDFIIVFDPDDKLGSWGRGKLRDLPGNVALMQLDGQDRLIHICNCGSGFTEDMRQDILRRVENNTKKIKGYSYAGVGTVKYVSRSYISMGDNSNALKEPIFLGWHTDKRPSECINEKL